MYYLQSRYYNPTWGRFINADALVSTGQGILGNNMFAYCLNNPVDRYDPNGMYTGASCRINDQFATMSGGGGGGAIGLAIGTTAALATADLLDAINEKAETLTSRKTDSTLYTVYFLCANYDPSRTIIYVGRVKTENFEARMRYHKSVGRSYVSSIDGLDYATCRALEQAGMIFYHTINRNGALNNKIRGISPNNGNKYLYMAALWEVINRDMYTGNSSIPLSYLANLTEEAFLNGSI